ncbi:MAG TPA: shikimate kinase I, partial [Firmicutes bacterium]|nr:shikimate kinase I [Bacillota bacterium]
MQKLERIRNNIVLVGPMGCGKTTVGKLLARILNWEFIDTDQRIVEQTGLEIPMIFQEKGEQGFRQLEKEVISECSQMHQVVIATG